MAITRKDLQRFVNLTTAAHYDYPSDSDCGLGTLKKEYKLFGRRLESLKRHQAIAASMSQDQINACAWHMGCAGAGWTPQTLAAAYQPFIQNEAALTNV